MVPEESPRSLESAGFSVKAHCSPCKLGTSHVTQGELKTRLVPGYEWHLWSQPCGDKLRSVWKLKVSLGYTVNSVNAELCETLSQKERGNTQMTMILWLDVLV